MTEPLFQLFGMPVMPFAALIFVSAFLSAALCLLLFKREKISPAAGETFVLLALILGVFTGHILYCLTQISDITAEYGALFILNPAGGGFMVYGVMLGVFFAALLTGKMLRCSALRLLEAALPACALLIALCRFSEVMDAQGYGMQVFEEGMQFFPYAFKNEYDEWYVAIFFFEGLYAILIGLMMLLSKKKRKLGQNALLFLILYACAQVLFETLRRDQVIKWGFIRVSQLISVLLLAVVVLLSHLKARSAGKLNRRKAALSWTAFVLLTGACVGLEFTVDKPIPLGGELIYLPYFVTYSLIGLSAALMGLIAYRASIRN